MTSDFGIVFVNVTPKEEIFVRSHAEMPEEITLRELNDEEAKQYIGGAVFVSILMIIGIIGNLHVLYVYTLKMKPSNLRVFILCMAIVDMLTSSIGMPFVLYDLTHPLTFFAPFVCKALRFLNYFNSSASACILVLVSVERYRKICVPFGKQLTIKASKVCCGLVIVFAVLISWPAPVLYGQSTVPTRYMNITGSRCYTEDRFKDTPYQLYFNIFLILVFLITSLVLIVLYSLIGRQIFRQRVFRNKFMTKNKKEEKLGKGDDTVDKNKIFSKEAGSDTSTKSAAANSNSDSIAQFMDQSQGDPKIHALHKLEGTELAMDSNETHKYGSEVRNSHLYLGGDEMTGFHSENTDRTEVHFSSDEEHTKIYKGFENINDSPSGHVHGKGDFVATECETCNNGIFPIQVIYTVNSKMFNIGSVLPSKVNTDNCMRSMTLQTTFGTAGAESSQGTETATPHNSGPVLNGTNTVVTNGIYLETQEKSGMDKLNSTSKSTQKDRDKTRKITYILFLITVVYFCSFLPHLILKILAFLKKDFLLRLNFSEAFAYNTFVWSFFINNVANPFIYGFHDKNFKREVKLIYQRICCICRKYIIP
ncbi:hypothetical protein CHS0354_008042 [Potamilus streckersoni]|uniref:G-protein coupled receptors family 1 profile domain-containing protein n=1 Tax=Potamilus streckersoni TaxID=2493646 RepID=A0AAE0SFF3_9BIVA|nr:hypothetical protein CHS0354_008042 [Potamilus streckersoni]